jgi:hypothetical protein
MPLIAMSERRYFDWKRRGDAMRRPDVAKWNQIVFNLSCHNSLYCDRKDLSSHGNLRATHGVAPTEVPNQYRRVHNQKSEEVDLPGCCPIVEK